MSRSLPALEVPNPTGSCWTCVEQGAESSCDKSLPYCTQCHNAGRLCGGYHVRLRRLIKPNKKQDFRESRRDSIPTALNSLGLPVKENLLLQHFMHNVSRISIAVDYHGNGYRRFVVVALKDEGLLNGVLALSSSHLNRWQNRTDYKPTYYLRKSILHLQQRLIHPSPAEDDATFMAMMTLMEFEFWNDGSRWKDHYNGVLSWLEARDYNQPAIGSFMQSTLVTSALQVLMHNTGAIRKRTLAYLESVKNIHSQDGSSIEVILGYPLDMPHYIMQAVQLQEEVQRTKSTADEKQMEDLYVRVMTLRKEISSTPLPLRPKFGMLAQNIAVTASIDPILSQGQDHNQDREQDQTNLSPADLLEEDSIRESARAAAEIWRCALRIYVYRIVHDPLTTGSCPEEVSEDVTRAFELLPLIPDVGGPGSFLGWALVVIGAEINGLEKRQHIKRRLHSLSLLAFNQGYLNLQILDEVWRRRDSCVSGASCNLRCRWQEVMEDMGVNEAALI